MKKTVLTILLAVVVLAGFAQQLNQASWQQQVDYVIDVSLNDETHTLKGEIAITYHNNSPDDLYELYIHLWPNGYANNETAFGKQMMENGEMDFYYSKEEDRGNISGIKFSADGADITWDYAVIDSVRHIDVAHLTLSSPIKSGEKRTIFTPFTVKLPKVFSRLGHKEQDYFITQWYPKPAVYDVNGWNPMPYLNMGEFYSEFGTFKVNVTLPKNYTLVATGECQNAGELEDRKIVDSDTVPASSEDFKTVRFTAKDVHDFAWFASKRWGYETKKVMVNGKEVVLRVVAAEPDEGDLKHIQTAIDYYSDNVGPYPYSHATVVNGQLKAGGGMEYPMITLCDYMNEEVIVHEVGHNWFYGILANNERTYPWMDESINSYYEGQAMGAGTADKPDINAAIMMAFVKDNLLTNEHQAIATSSEELTNANYGISVYGIGAKSFEYLNAYLGDALFKKCMTTYYEQWKFKHPLPNDMKNSFEQTSGKDLRWFFDELLNTDTKIDYAICKHKKGFELENKGSVAAPVPVDFVRNGVGSTEWFTVDANAVLIIEDTSKNRKAAIDARNETLDLHQGNNNSASKIKLKVVTGLDKAKYKEVYVVPTFGWNFYDKTMVGLGIHNYSLSNKPLQYHVLPMYSFEKKTVNGEAEISYTKPLHGKAEYLELGAKARRYSFDEGGLVRDNEEFVRAEYSFLKVQPYVTYHFPKSTQRSSRSKSISLSIDQVLFSPQFDFVSSDTLPGPVFSKSRSNSFVTLTYRTSNKRKINGSSLELSAEYGRLTSDDVLGSATRVASGVDSITVFPFSGTDVSSSDFAKLSGVYKRGVDIGIKNKPLEIRVYGAVMIKASNNDIYNLQLGSRDKAGYYDYKFDHYLMHRNAEVGLFQNQINNGTNSSKFVGSIASADQWLVSALFTVPLPGKIPLKPYVEFVSFNDIDKERWNTDGVQLIFNAGIELEIIKDRFEIFFNLAQSNDITSYQDGTNGGLLPGRQINSFAERITFVLDLNGLVPSRLKRNLNLI